MDKIIARRNRSKFDIILKKLSVCVLDGCVVLAYSRIVSILYSIVNLCIPMRFNVHQTIKPSYIKHIVASMCLQSIWLSCLHIHNCTTVPVLIYFNARKFFRWPLVWNFDSSVHTKYTRSLFLYDGMYVYLLSICGTSFSFAPLQHAVYCWYCVLFPGCI